MTFRRLAALLPGVLLLTAPGAHAQADARPAVFVSAGTYTPSDFYSDEYVLVPEALSFTAGGEVPVVRRPALTGTVGAALRFARVRIYDYDAGFGGEIDRDEPVFESGLRPQHLDLYGRVAGGGLSATAGFVLDLGPDEALTGGEAGEELAFFNSDAQHAVRLGVGAERAAGPVRLSAALDAFLTFAKSYTTVIPYTPPGPGSPNPTDSLLTISGTIDFGDTFAARAGAGYPVGPVEVGLDVLYAATTALRQTSEGLPPQTEGDGRWLLSLAPRVTFAPAGAPVEVEVAMRARGGWYGEHVPYGITLAGEGQPAVRFPVTLGLRVAL